MANAWPPPSPPPQLTSKVTDIYFHCFHSGSGERTTSQVPLLRGGGTRRNSIVRIHHSSADDTRQDHLSFSSYSNLKHGTYRLPTEPISPPLIQFTTLLSKWKKSKK